ncbi:MAG: WYL domain-containing protein [Ruminococcaceae bacterium]|nr:WYL domain-containing protein [Oscillospiraceae bacterium]
MAYSELVKKFERVREYMREFYVYGFKSRDEFDNKSARSYDDERRRIDSWLGEYLSFRRTQEGKNVFLSIDSRAIERNPLYKAWKTCSFTDGDITLHFIIFDILYHENIALTLSQITEKIDTEYLAHFDEPMIFDESTVRKKLKEYVDEGLIHTEKYGKKLMYSRMPSVKTDGMQDAIDFFSETAPCGIVGSFLIDKMKTAPRRSFSFKHHYITSTLDSQVLCDIFDAMAEKRAIRIKNKNPKLSQEIELTVVPVRVFISVQSGRQYLLGIQMQTGVFRSYRLDYITDVKLENACGAFDEYRRRLDEIQKHTWGVTISNKGGKTEKVRFSVKFAKNEQHIYGRLLREKRCGKVTRTSETTASFEADVYDINEMIPWIRTFICRITELSFSNRELEKQFKEDLQMMYELYGVEGDEADDVQ